jgi:hypothetical protein
VTAKPRGPARQPRVRLAGSGMVVDIGDVLDAMPERRFDEWFRQLAKRLGYRAFHCRRSTGSERGFPDWILLRRSPPRAVAIELKRGTRQPTPAQQDWLDDFAACGIETHIWRPSDRDEIVRVLEAGDAR